MSIEKAINDYKTACNAVINVFSKKYEVSVTEEDWVAGVVGGKVCINDEFYIDMEDVILMLTKDVSWNEFLRWWDYNIDANYLGIRFVNLVSWLKGAPRLSREQLDNLKEKRQELDKLIEDANEKY